MKLNHMDLPVPDVAATAAFFARHFSFRLQERRGDKDFAILVGESGFVLILSRRGADGASAFPQDFHIGFLLDSDEAVHAAHAGVAAGGLAAELGAVNRAYGALMFFCRAPGNILIEVSHRPA
jgi:catechol 2,3-dioxygenase-like lactoylglutathione lyase family enzyme